MKNKPSISNKKLNQKANISRDSNDSINRQNNIKEIDSKIKPQPENTQNSNKKRVRKEDSYYVKTKLWIKKWLTSRPATKAAWTDASASLIAVIIAFITLFATLIFNYYIISQNSTVIKSSQESVKIAQKSLFSSISVSMNITFPRAWEKQIVKVENTSPYPLNNVDIYLIYYEIQKDKILQRSQSSEPFIHYDIVKPNQVLNLKSPDIFNSSRYEQYSGKEFYSLVIISQRESDNRRFVHVEPFSAPKIENQISFFPLYLGKGIGGSGPPERMMKLVDSIEKTEKSLFRSSDR